MNLEFSLVVLCYGAKEYPRIFSKQLIEVLDKRGLDYEIILVGNYIPGKDEITPKVVGELAESHPRIRAVIKKIEQQGEGGMGWNMRSGLEAARGNSIGVIDGDGQMPAQDVVRVYNKLMSENLDLCKTQRISRDDGMWRKFISRAFNTLMILLFPGISPADINGKPKIMTRAAYEKLNLESSDWFIDAEIMIKARRLNLRIGNVETVFYKHPRRASFISFRAIWEFIKNIVRYRIKEFSATHGK